VLAYEAERQGAGAVVFYYLNGYAQDESGRALNTHDGVARSTIPIVQIGKNDGMRVAEVLTRRGPIQATLRSKVEANPAGTGYNIIGKIPGRLAGRYLIISAHYDAWFHGYWDNAIGVAGILAMAKALLEYGYQPEHTLLFISTDAEEFGAPDTNFDWLIGCYHLLQAHPEWQGRVSAAFNIDTLAYVGQEQLEFIGPPELLPFVREAVGNYRAKTFPKPEVGVKEQVTAWTEVLTYAYFGIPPLQPGFAIAEPKRTFYHTQFDTADIVHRERAVESVQLYGALLVRLDRQAILPYEFTERVQSLRATIENPPDGEAVKALGELRGALDRLEQQAERLNLLRLRVEEAGSEAEAVNDRLRQVAVQLVKQLNYLNAEDPEDALPLHVFYERDLLALDTALAHLAGGDAAQAMVALTDSETGLHGTEYALEVSYPVYYRRTVGAQNPGRQDLFWGEKRTAQLTDIWMELHSLQDKVARGVTDFGAEEHRLREKRQMVAAAYREAVMELGRVVEEAVGMLAG
jgi:hypothetical protein